MTEYRDCEKCGCTLEVGSFDGDSTLCVICEDPANGPEADAA